MAKKWSNEDTNLLSNLIKQGLTCKKISEVLNKTEGAVKIKCHRLGIFYTGLNLNRKDVVCINCKKVYSVVNSSESKFCSRSCSATYNNTGRKQSKKTKDKIRDSLISGGNLFRPTIKKGSESHMWVNRIESICLYCKKPIIHKETEKRKYHAECYRKCSGGYIPKSGVGKGGWYKSFWCDSTYELVWIIYNIDHKIPFERNKRPYTYFWEGKKCKYYPDFIQGGRLIEIKGYIDGRVLEKVKCVENLKILLKDDLEKHFQYVISNYGKNFIELYEGNPHKELTNKCKLCGNLCKAKNVYCSRSCAGAGNNRNSKIR